MKCRISHNSQLVGGLFNTEKEAVKYAVNSNIISPNTPFYSTATGKMSTVQKVLGENWKREVEKMDCAELWLHFGFWFDIFPVPKSDFIF